jgi:hypothetical protein
LHCRASLLQACSWLAVHSSKHRSRAGQSSWSLESERERERGGGGERERFVMSGVEKKRRGIYRIRCGVERTPSCIYFFCLNSMIPSPIWHDPVPVRNKSSLNLFSIAVDFKME